MSMTESLRRAADEFLAQSRIAVSGASHDQPNAGNFIYRRLRSAGYTVFAVNPNAEGIEGDPCFHSLAEIPGPPVDGVIVATHPGKAADVVREAAAHHVPRVWLHRSFGEGSVSTEAIEIARREGIALIDGACPMMFVRPDIGHVCMRWILSAAGRMPSAENYKVSVRAGP